MEIKRIQMLGRGDVVELEVESAGFEGTAIARDQGLVIFVNGGVPGDHVRAKISRVKKKHCEAEIVEVLRPSPRRITPRCSHFGICGGCRWQHVDYALQCSFKHQHVVDALERIGGLKNPVVLPVLASDEIFFYRNKLEFSFGDTPWLTQAEMVARLQLSEPASAERSLVLGFHAPERYDKIIPIAACYLQSELSNQILRWTHDYCVQHSLPVYSLRHEEGYLRNLVIREGKHTGDVMVNVVTFYDQPEIMQSFCQEIIKAFPEITTVVNNINGRKAQIATGEIERVYYGPGFIRERIGKNIFAISANSFFQTNSLQVEKLYALACDYAHPRPTDTVYDLYCGTGTIALTIADSVHRVIGIDIVENAIKNARKNAEYNTVTNVEFLVGDLKDLLTLDTDWMTKHPRADVVLIDPPRSGMHPKAVAEIIELKIPRIVYVSCNPTTLARDLALLIAGGYHLGRIQPVDMFPHTFHIETVVELSLDQK